MIHVTSNHGFVGLARRKNKRDHERPSLLLLRYNTLHTVKLQLYGGSQMLKSLQNQIIQLADVTDKLGMPIDEGIILPVAALRACDFNTTGSCEGHLDRPKAGGPYITIESAEAYLYEQKMKGVTFDGQEFNLYREELRGKNLKVRRRLLKLIDEFYRDRASPTKIYIRNIGPGTSKLRCQGVEEAETLSAAERGDWLWAAHKEFTDFANWLVSERK